MRGLPGAYLTGIFEPTPDGAVVEEGFLKVHRAFAEEAVLVVRDQVPEGDLEDAVHEFVPGYAGKAQVGVPDGVLAGGGYFGLDAVGIGPKWMILVLNTD